MAILHLETLSGISKGLTRTNEDVFGIEDDPVVQAALEKIKKAREDLRMFKIREDIYGILRSIVDFWSTDASVSHVRSSWYRKSMISIHVYLLVA